MKPCESSGANCQVGKFQNTFVLFLEKRSIQLLFNQVDGTAVIAVILSFVLCRSTRGLLSLQPLFTTLL